MATTKKEIHEMIELITLALPREKEAYHFYKNAAKRSESVEAKRLFDFLALQEKGHEQSLKKLLADLKQQLERKNA